MSLKSLIVNDWSPTALFAVTCCALLAAVGCGGFTDGNGLALLLFNNFPTKNINKINYL